MEYVPTNVEDWAKSDAYHNAHLLQPDQALNAAVANGRANGLPDIAVSAAQGKFMNLLVRSMGAKRILEVGTLAGYSTIWLGRGLPEGGRLITCEVFEEYAKVARENIEKAGLSDKVEVKVGPALETIKNLQSDQPFDLVFIDADKDNNLNYFLEAKRLTKKGSVIIVDNVVQYGRVASAPEPTDDPYVPGVRTLLKHLKNDKDVDATTLATVGEKGYDGFLYAIRL